MPISINVPVRTEIISGGFEVGVAPRGASWHKSQLGDYADRSGVYIHHADGNILYVGKTTVGKWGVFGERLRREFQESSAGGSFLYQLLAKQTVSIRSYLLDLDNLDILVNAGSMQLTKKRKALVVEQILIGIFDPLGNRS